MELDINIISIIIKKVKNINNNSVKFIKESIESIRSKLREKGELNKNNSKNNIMLNIVLNFKTNNNNNNNNNKTSDIKIHEGGSIAMTFLICTLINVITGAPCWTIFILMAFIIIILFLVSKVQGKKTNFYDLFTKYTDIVINKPIKKLVDFILSFFYTKTKSGGGGENDFNLIINDKEKLKKIYKHIKITKNIYDIKLSDSIEYYNYKNEYGDKNEYISEFYEYIVKLLYNKLNKEGIRSIKILKRLELILNTYYNNEITKRYTNSLLIKIEKIREKNDKNKTEKEKSFIIELDKKLGNREIIKNEINKHFISSLEDIDKNIFKLKILNSYKKNVVNYEINKYTFNQFRNEISNKIPNKIIPQNIKTIQQIVNQKLISNNNQIVKNIKTKITNKKKNIKTQINILKSKDLHINKDLYKEIHQLYKEIDEESKIIQVGIKNNKQISFKNNNYTRYKKINEYVITSNTEINKKIFNIKELIKTYIDNIKKLEINEQTKNELIKIMPLILKIKKIEKNINNQSQLKNKLTSNIDEKGFINNLYVPSVVNNFGC